MIEELVDMVPDFLGPANQRQCFMHVLNLIAKTIIKQFDIPKTNANSALMRRS
jgi:hypothetical protein